MTIKIKLDLVCHEVREGRCLKAHSVNSGVLLILVYRQVKSENFSVRTSGLNIESPDIDAELNVISD